MRHHLVVAVAMLSLTSGCSDPAVPEANDPSWAQLNRSCPADAPATSLSPARRDTIGEYAGALYQDALWARYARQAPGGFAGLFFAPGSGRQTGPLTVLLARPHQRAAALEALERLFRDAGDDRIAAQLPGAVVQPARWDFAQLFDWRRYLDRHAWKVQGVTMADTDEVENRIQYGVVDEAARERLTRVLRGLDLPCYLVGIKIVPPASWR